MIILMVTLFVDFLHALHLIIGCRLIYLNISRRQQRLSTLIAVTNHARAKINAKLWQGRASDHLRPAPQGRYHNSADAIWAHQEAAPNYPVCVVEVRTKKFLRFCCCIYSNDAAASDVALERDGK
jgi:hypothetical protein